SEKGPSCGLIEDRCTSGLRIPFSVTGRAAICATGSSEPEAEESAETTICVAPCRAGGRIPWIEMVLPLVLAPRETPGPDTKYRDRVPFAGWRGAKPRIAQTASASAASDDPEEGLCDLK